MLFPKMRGSQNGWLIITYNGKSEHQIDERQKAPP
jgi:hypothetical protein